jgi:hypothetical protein
MFLNVAQRRRKNGQTVSEKDRPKPQDCIPVVVDVQENGSLALEAWEPANAAAHLFSLGVKAVI